MQPQIYPLPPPQICLELSQPWFESGVSEDALSAHMQLIVPGQTACFQCAPPLMVAQGIDEATLKRDRVCAASLPTTMSLTASLVVQNVLKYILNFGEVTPYMSYAGLMDHVYKMDSPLKPNPTCTNTVCTEL